MNLQRSAEHRLGSDRLAGQLAEPLLGAPVRGWVLYDGDCPLCVGAVARFAPLLNRHGFQCAPLPTRFERSAGLPTRREEVGFTNPPGRRPALRLNPGEPLDEMKLLAGDGQIFGGADALAQIARRIWWAWPLFALAQIPGVKILLRAIYRGVAANRQCVGGACRMKPRSRHRAATTFLEIP